MMIAGTATVALAAPGGNGGPGQGGPGGNGPRMEQQLGSEGEQGSMPMQGFGYDQGTPPELPSGEMPQFDGTQPPSGQMQGSDESGRPELPSGAESGDESMTPPDGTGNGTKGQKPAGEDRGQRPDGMGKGRKGKQADIVSGVTEAIESVEDEVTRAGLQALLSDFTAALDAEREAFDDESTDEDALTELQTATEEARTALLEALSDAGVDVSAFERPEKPSDMENGGEMQGDGSFGGHAVTGRVRPDDETADENGQPAIEETERSGLPGAADGNGQGVRPGNAEGHAGASDDQSGEATEKVGFFRSISNWFKSLFDK